MRIPQRVLIIRPGALGDTILALPAVSVLRRAWPDAEFCWVGYPASLEWLKGTPYLNDCRSIDSRLFCHLFDGTRDDALGDFLCQYDYCVAWVRDSEISAAPGIHRIFEDRCLLAAPFPREGAGVHASDHLLQTLRGIADAQVWNALADARTESPLRKVRFPKETALECAFCPPQVMIHPGSGDRRKCWPIERFQAVAEALQAQAGAETCWVLGPADLHLIGELQRYCDRNNMKLITGAALRELALLLRGMRIYLGNDSGVTHLSAALGIETWAMFGPTSPKEWAPPGNHVHTFWLPEAMPPMPDDPSATTGKKGELERITPKMVIDSILNALAIRTKGIQNER